MFLWHKVFDIIKPLRNCCACPTSFLWLVVAICGFCTGPDLMGVTSLIRCAYLQGSCYPRLNHLFKGHGVRLPDLTACWIRIVANRFQPVVVGGKYTLFVADGINVPKEARKMPAVQSLHNASGNNNKLKFVMGHHFETIAMVCKFGEIGAVAVPLISRITGGIKLSNRCAKTLLDKVLLLFSRGV